MKYLSTITLLLVIALSGFSQTSNMVFFSEYGERFTLYINSVQQNPQPTANLKLTNMQPAMKYSVRIVFAADSIDPINDNVSLLVGVEKTWKIKPKDTRAANAVNKHLNPKDYANGNLKPVKINYVLRVQTEAPLMNQTIQGQSNQQVINYGDPSQNKNTNSNTTINLDHNQQAVHMNVNTNGTVSSTTNRTTTSTTTSTSTNGVQYGQNVTVTVPSNNYHGCPKPLTLAQFNLEKNKMIAQKTRAGKKLVAKKISQTKCLTSQQIYTVAKLINYESDRLEYTKLAFTRCWDPENYELVYNAFALSSSVEELNTYIESTGLADANVNTNTNVNTSSTIDSNNTNVNSNPNNPFDVNININTNTNQQDPNYHTNQNNTNTNQNRQNTTVYVPGYSGPTGCPMPMNNGDFQAAKGTISSKTFESTKLEISKQVLGSNCMTAEQVTEVTRLFEFESSKLEFAKFAYTHTYDKGNYFKVNNAFEFESSITDLQNYIKGK